MADRVGQRFGDYRLTRFLGRGGFGDVYLGEHVRDKTLAAVKVLKTDPKDETDPNEILLSDFGIAVVAHNTLTQTVERE